MSRSYAIDCHVWPTGGPEERTEPGPLRSRAQVSLRQTCPSQAFGPLWQPAVKADCSIARHGWGITPNPSLAISYLSQAAANAADIEAQALGAGMKKGGAAKGELVLAIYELVRS